jgi:uncharacterized protein
MDRKLLIERTEIFVRENLKAYDSGHDWWHIERVRRMALYINEKEALSDPFLVEITALLHDTADSKFASGDSNSGYRLIGDFIDRNEMADIKERLLNVIRKVSFSNKHESGNSDDPLLWVIQDADRLDAIGAIGIARAFNYGGFRNNKIYNPVRTDSEDQEVLPGRGTASTISHFYEKLLLLKDLMKTNTGRQLAMERHEFLEIFLKQFYNEWEFGNETT